MKRLCFFQKHYNFSYFVLFLLIVIDFNLSFVYSKLKTRYLFNYSEISLVIQGSGIQSIINEEFPIEPSEVIVNGINKDNKCKKTCELDKESNNVTLRFDQYFNTCENMFKDLINIKEIDLSNFEFNYIINMSSMFYNCFNLETINFGNINSSSVQDMNSLFYYCSNLKSIDLSNFDTSSVTNMERMFVECSSLQTLNVSNFNTAKVESMRSMFNRCKSITEIDISKFDTSKVTSMALMFYNCLKLTKITFGNINTSSLEDMQRMFYCCKDLTTIDISNFYTSKVTSISYMFYNCTNLKTVKLGKMNTSSVVDMKCLFYHCENLQSADLSSFNTSLVTDMGWMFFHCYNIESIIFSKSFITSNVVNMKSMFSNNRKMTSIDLSHFDTSKVTDMSYMFTQCKQLKFLNLSNFSPTNITIIEDMFYTDDKLFYLDLRLFKINNKTNIARVLNNVTSRICIEDEYTKNILNETNKNIIFICSDTCYNEDFLGIDYINNECIKLYIDNGLEYEYNNSYYNKCPVNTYATLKKPKICYDKAPEGYYLDKSELIFKECYINCTDCSECYVSEIETTINNILNGETQMETKILNITFLLDILMNRVNLTELNNGDDVSINNDGDDRLMYTITTTYNQKKITKIMFQQLI